MTVINLETKGHCHLFYIVRSYYCGGSGQCERGIRNNILLRHESTHFLLCNVFHLRKSVVAIG